MSAEQDCGSFECWKTRAALSLSLSPSVICAVFSASKRSPETDQARTDFSLTCATVTKSESKYYVRRETSTAVAASRFPRLYYCSFYWQKIYYLLHADYKYLCSGIFIVWE